MPPAAVTGPADTRPLDDPGGSVTT